MSIWSCAFLFFTPSCIDKRINNRLLGHQDTQVKAIKDLSESVFKNEQKHLNWNEALELLHENNTQLNTAASAIEKAKKARIKIWIDLVPDIFLFSDITSSISKLSSLTSSDLDSGLYANLRIPSPFNLYSRSYSLALSELQAENSYELIRRQLHSTLYNHFNRSEELREEMKDLKKEREMLESVSISSIPAQLITLQRRQKNIRLNLERHRVAINRELNTPGENWYLMGGLPNVSYANKVNKVDLKQGYGSLALRVQAIQIEQAVISLKAVKLKRLPSLNFNLNSSNVLNSNNDDIFQFDAENMTLFSGLNKAVEIDDIWDTEDLQNAEERFKISREQLLLTIERETSQIATTKILYASLLKERNKIESRISDILKQTNSASVQKTMNDLKKYEDYKKQRTRLNRQILQMDLQFWIWDENFWNKY